MPLNDRPHFVNSFLTEYIYVTNNHIYETPMKQEVPSQHCPAGGLVFQYEFLVV